MTSTELQTLSPYLQQIHTIPVLSAEEEIQLATRYREQSDLMAAQQLVVSHLRYVVRIARTYKGYGLALADLVQEGTIGLMKAVKRFDPKIGVRLVAFAVHWIKAEIHDFVIRHWRIVKVATTKAQRKLFFNLRKAKKRLGWFSSEEIKAVAEDLGVTPRDVREMEMRLAAHDDMIENHENLSDNVLLEDKRDNLAQSQDKLHAALALLDARSSDIVSGRWFQDPKVSLKTLAERYSVSIERIRQLEKAAMAQLRKSLADESEAFE